MKREEANKYKFHVDKKLQAEGVEPGDRKRALKVLGKGMGGKMQKAFTVLYGGGV